MAERRPATLGYATDLALIELEGGTVEARDGYWVTRSPANPTYHWGNSLVLDRAPEPGSLRHWVDVFRGEHPGAAHLTIGIADPSARLDPEEAALAGAEIERDTVLTATRLAGGPAPEGVRLTLVDPDDERTWTALVDLEMSDDFVGEPEAHRRFVERRLSGHRAASRAGHGTWCAALLPDGTPVATLGVYAVGAGLARFQSVLTHPSYRRRGLAGALVRLAGDHALTALGAHTLVIVADPDGPAIGSYRRAGFTDHGDQWAWYSSGG